MTTPALAFVLLTAATSASAQQPSASSSCPQVAGHYRIEGSKHALEDAMKAFGVRLAGFHDGDDLWLNGRPEDGLEVSVTRRGRDAKATPDIVLRHGTSFLCKDGWIVSPPLANARRETDKGWYLGESVVRIGRGDGGNLAVDLAFTGRQSITLLQYEPGLAVPKPFSTTNLRETLLWQAAPVPRQATSEPADAPEIADVRAKLEPLLESVTVISMRPDGGAVLAVLKARNSDDVTRLEDRMRAAALRYAVKTPPSWTGTGYRLEYRLWPSGEGGAR